MTKPKTVHLYPVPGVSLYPYPAEECDVPEDVAAFLLAHVPPPFTVEAPIVTPWDRFDSAWPDAPSPPETAATGSEG